MGMILSKKRYLGGIILQAQLGKPQKTKKNNNPSDSVAASRALPSESPQFVFRGGATSDEHSFHEVGKYLGQSLGKNYMVIISQP